MNPCLHYVLVFAFHIHIFCVCYTMLVQRFELQSRRFTNFGYYYYKQHKAFLIQYSVSRVESAHALGSLLFLICIRSFFSRNCLEVQGLIRETFNVFTDTETGTDVTSLQFYGFQFLGREKDALTFECDVFLCGDVTGGPCGEVLAPPPSHTHTRPVCFSLNV